MNRRASKHIHTIVLPSQTVDFLGDRIEEMKKGKEEEVAVLYIWESGVVEVDFRGFPISAEIVFFWGQDLY